VDMKKLADFEKYPAKQNVAVAGWQLENGN
jgi:hypothetical protein